MQFRKRTTGPLDDNKWYLRPNKGYNKNIQGNNKHKLNHGSYDVLPNCTGYSYGRWMECQEMKKSDLPSYTTAEEYLNKNTVYEEGWIPRVGSIMVWQKGKQGKKDGSGHVENVEDMKKNADAFNSTSGWNAKKKRVWTQTIEAGSKFNYYYKKDYTYLGCIYPKENFGIGFFGTIPTENLKAGSKGKQVKNLQIFLCWCLGIHLSIDGHYGSATTKAVREYQKKYGLQIDGKFGPACRKTASSIKF